MDRKPTKSTGGERTGLRSDARPPADWLVGGGEMGDLIRSTDWTGTPLGPRERWPQSLRTVANLVLETRFPKALLWGRELILLYNDAYRVIAADRHPRALGRSTREIWPEVWNINEPIFTAVLERGESIYLEDKLFPIDRHGRREDAYFTLCYSPVRVEDGHVAGSLVTLLETTRRVREHRTLDTEREQAELAAKRERERLAALVNSIPDEVWFADAQKRFTLANPAAVREFTLGRGKPVEVADFLADLEVLRPDCSPRPVEESPALRALAGETVANQQEVVRTPATGELRWREVNASPVRDADGGIIGSVSVVRDITERKQAEEALRRSHKTLAELIERAPFGIYIVDSQFRIAQMNAASQSGAFQNVRPVIGRDFSDAMRILWPEPVAAEIVAEFRHTLETGEPYRSAPFINPRHDVAIVESYEWELHRVTLPDGQYGVICYYFDSTTLRQTEEALREGETLLRAVIDTIAEPLYVKDAEGRLTLVNAATVAVVGKPREQIVGHTDREFYEDPAVGEAICEHDRRVMESGTVQVFEERVPTPNGYRIMLNTKAPRRDASGRVVGLVGVARDITEGKRTEEALREGQERLRLALSAGAMATWDWNLATGEVVWNDEHFRMLGYEPGTVRPSFDAWAERVHPADRAATEALVMASVEKGGEYRGDFRALRPDGSVRWIEARGRMELSAEGKPSRQYGVMTDITERKRAEEALREADRRKDEFLAVLSHELRNPLAPIRNSLYVLEHTTPGGEQAERAQAVIGRQVTHLARLVDDLLDVTRIARGKIQLQRERLDLLALIRRTVEDHRAALASSDLELEVVLPSEPVQIHADPTRIAQVVGNLLENARKFTPRGGRVVVSLRRAGEDAVIGVRDTGEGIAPDLLPRLFEPFMQATQTIDRSRGGLGLGLALSKGLVDQHGGTMTAVSAGLGHGAEFTVRLPIDVQAERTGFAASPAPVVRGRRVLVIEDNPDAAESLREALELGGHDVAIAHDGPEGVRAARDLMPEVVLCDIGLPGVDGYEVARSLRADAKLAGCLLVALTGYALPEDIAKATAAGFHQHLAKPPSMEKLEQVLANHGDERR